MSTFSSLNPKMLAVAIRYPENLELGTQEQLDVNLGSEKLKA